MRWQFAERYNVRPWVSMGGKRSKIAAEKFACTDGSKVAKARQRAPECLWGGSHFPDASAANDADFLYSNYAVLHDGSAPYRAR